MQILKNKTNFDFIGKRKVALFISSILNIAVLVGIATVGFNYGVDFAGGTLVELKFSSEMSQAALRDAAVRGGLHDPQVQQVGSREERSFLLRLGGVTQLTQESAEKAQAVLPTLGELAGAPRVDLDNGIINFRTRQKVAGSDSETAPQRIEKAIRSAGLGVKEVRELGETAGMGFDYQVVSAGMADKVREALAAAAPDAKFELRRVDYVGPQVGKQLRNKGIMALLYAMVFILIYVAFRFDLKFGPGALVAMVHDVIMVAGYYLVSRREFNLTSIAALLTILGYSINDTIVIYDRIREEMARFKGKSLPEIINIAVNETLARTILTSGVTALSLVGLLVFGVGEIFDFAAAMLVGIVVGTYSSVYIASPLTIWLDEFLEQRERVKRAAPAQTKLA